MAFGATTPPSGRLSMSSEIIVSANGSMLSMPAPKFAIAWQEGKEHVHCVVGRKAVVWKRKRAEIESC